MAQLARARVLIAQFRGEEAIERLTPVLQAAERKGWSDIIIKGLVLNTLALEQGGDAELAIATLQRGLAMAEPEHYVRAITGEGAAMTRLLKKIRALQESGEPGSNGGPSREYLDMLLHVLGVAPNGDNEAAPRNGGGGQAGSQALLTPISDREIEVLTLIADGKSNASIADTLYISVSTVKTHINNLYSKLGVESRTQALARAKEFNLL
jgi:LuxR family maltose regulon positive regulatory protein